MRCHCPSARPGRLLLLLLLLPLAAVIAATSNRMLPDGCMWSCCGTRYALAAPPALALKLTLTLIWLPPETPSVQV